MDMLGSNPDVNMQADQLIPDQNEMNYDDMFDYLDTDGSGQLTKQELRKATMLRNWNTTKDDIDKLLVSCDEDGDRKISRDEFGPLMEKMMSHMPSQEDLDRENDDAISPLFETEDECMDSRDFRDLLTAKGSECMTEEEVDEFLDMNGLRDKDRLTKDDVRMCFRSMS